MSIKCYAKSIAQTNCSKMPTATIWLFSPCLQNNTSIHKLVLFNDFILVPEALMSINYIILHIQAFMNFSRCSIVYLILNCSTISQRSTLFSNSRTHSLLPKSIIYKIQTQFLWNSTKYYTFNHWLAECIQAVWQGLGSVSNKKETRQS